MQQFLTAFRESRGLLTSSRLCVSPVNTIWKYFGVVTAFEFRLHPVGPTVLAGPILWDTSEAGEVLRFYRDFIRDAPDELGTVVRFVTAPPLPVIPENLQ